MIAQGIEIKSDGEADILWVLDVLEQTIKQDAVDLAEREHQKKAANYRQREAEREHEQEHQRWDPTAQPSFRPPFSFTMLLWVEKDAQQTYLD